MDTPTNHSDTYLCLQREKAVSGKKKMKRQRKLNVSPAAVMEMLSERVWSCLIIRGPERVCVGRCLGTTAWKAALPFVRCRFRTLTQRTTGCSKRFNTDGKRKASNSFEKKVQKSHTTLKCHFCSDRRVVRSHEPRDVFGALVHFLCRLKHAKRCVQARRASEKCVVFHDR